MGCAVLGRNRVFWVLLWSCRWLRRSVAPWAEGTPPVAWWRFGEGVGRVELGWNGLRIEVEILVFSDRRELTSVCGGMWEMLCVLG